MIQSTVLLSCVTALDYYSIDMFIGTKLHDGHFQKCVELDDTVVPVCSLCAVTSPDVRTRWDYWASQTSHNSEGRGGDLFCRCVTCRFSVLVNMCVEVLHDVMDSTEDDQLFE